MHNPTQNEKAICFRNLHKSGDPLILTNIWDVGSMNFAIKKGTKAIATASAAVSASNGYEDGENIPVELILDLAQRLVKETNLPISIDFESGFASEIDKLKLNLKNLISTGIVGCNIEDTNHKTGGMFDIETAAARISAIKSTIHQELPNFYLNARIDCFLQSGTGNPEILKSETIERARAYKEAGASGLFIPLLYDWDLISFLVKETDIPINLMGGPKDFDLAKSKAAGVARISYGPYPYRAAMAAFEQFVSPLLT